MFEAYLFTWNDFYAWCSMACYMFRSGFLIKELNPILKRLIVGGLGYKPYLRLHILIYVYHYFDFGFRFGFKILIFIQVYIFLSIIKYLYIDFIKLRIFGLILVIDGNLQSPTYCQSEYCFDFGWSHVLRNYVWIPYWTGNVWEVSLAFRWIVFLLKSKFAPLPIEYRIVSRIYCIQLFQKYSRFAKKLLLRTHGSSSFSEWKAFGT